ncbi:MAG TPA: class I SAM-dependent methyltransferase [Reyranella sp.]|jgi:SAM-dependent methyltransferase|nr:class I SAM-dependent methyltransferase [Reyranella sp.]
MSQQDRSAEWSAYYEKLRDRPPRKTLMAALDKFGSPPADALAVDLGCGDGRDVVELLRRGWNVVAVDAEAEALKRLAERKLPGSERITPIVSRMEDVPLPLGAQLVNSSFAMPLCEPAKFHALWQRIREALPPGGRFSGQWYGPRDSWFGRPGMAFVSRAEAETMLQGLDVEMFEEEEADGVTPRGKPKHWHIFHIVARKP